MTAFLLICLAIGAVVFVFGGIMTLAAGMSDANEGDGGGCAVLIAGLVIAALSAGALLVRWLI
jgi:hypothetical protein